MTATPTIDYWFTPVSPWTYLGHERLRAIAETAGATVRVRPVDLGGRVFPVSGGLPLAKRAPQRQAYRLVELRRWSEFLGVPIVPQPAHFPVSPDDAARLIVAVDLHDGGVAAMAIAGAVLRACWREQRNVSDPAVLEALLRENGLAARRWEDAHSQAVQERYDADTERAIETGVFGAPTYAVDGELFWGQDRLDFVERVLRR
jgi:2-hydroxychromene-2-carboxylate isomerase